MKCTIKSIRGRIIWSGEAESTRHALIHAINLGADITGADLTGVDIPIIQNIDASILASIESKKAAGTNGLKMDYWHGHPCNITNWCKTTHCRAGYAICLAGKAGFELEKKFGPAAAGALIYAKSRPNKSIPNFYASDKDAMTDIRQCAKENQ